MALRSLGSIPASRTITSFRLISLGLDWLFSHRYKVEIRLHHVSPGNIAPQINIGTFDGTFKKSTFDIPSPWGVLFLTDIFVKSTKHKGSSAGEKYSDGGGMYLSVKAAGKYWRFDYRCNGKRKTLAFGVYPAVSLSKARIKRDEARQLLADGADPGVAKKQAKLNSDDAAQNTFQKLGEEWLEKTTAKRKAITQERVAQLLKMDIYPFIGKIPISQTWAYLQHYRAL